MIILPGQIENITTRRDRTWKITIGTNELTPEQASEVVKLNMEFCYVAFKPDKFRKDEELIIDNLHSEFDFSEKPPSQRLRAVLYIMWKADNEGFKDANLHYLHYIEKVIEHYKSKLPERN